jgi:hypothetical protein
VSCVNEELKIQCILELSHVGTIQGETAQLRVCSFLDAVRMYSINNNPVLVSELI